MKYLLVVLAIFGLLAGCASKQVNESLSCVDKNWGKFGKKMAESGHEVRAIDKYKSGCADFSDDDMGAYLDGFSRGLISYCTYENGFEQGEKNMKINNICPYEIQEHYVRGYEEGQREYELSMKKYEELQEDVERRNEDDNRTWRREQDANAR